MPGSKHTHGRPSHDGRHFTLTKDLALDERRRFEWGWCVGVCCRRRQWLLWRGLRRWRRSSMSHLTQVHYRYRHTSNTHIQRHHGRPAHLWYTLVLV